jgi:hypothetical protein
MDSKQKVLMNKYSVTALGVLDAGCSAMDFIFDPLSYYALDVHLLHSDFPNPLASPVFHL